MAGRAIFEEDLCVVNDIVGRPDRARLSRGKYDTSSFAVVRVPLIARGEALGILTATERRSGAEVTARDRKLLEGFDIIGCKDRGKRVHHVRGVERLDYQPLNFFVRVAHLEAHGKPVELGFGQGECA